MAKHLRAARDNFGQLVVDDVPLRVHHLLVGCDVSDANLRVVTLCLELELHIEQNNLGVGEGLCHLLEAGVGKRLLESDTFHEH